MRVGGLDIATNSGFAVIDGAHISAVTFRTKDKAAKNAPEDEVVLVEASRLSGLRLFLRGWLIAERIEFCGIESPLMGKSADVKWVPDPSNPFGGKKPVVTPTTNPKTDAFLHAMNRVARMTCLELGVPFRMVATATHRKAFLGRGNIPEGMGKPLSLEKCRQLGLNLKSNDASDAVSVAWWAAGVMHQERVLTGDLFKTG